MKVSVVVPVYNAAASLRQLVDALQSVLPELSEEHEIILVNDASKDESWQLISRLSEENSHVRGINLMRNYGQHNALLCGIRSARYDITVTLDDDLQNPPTEIPKLLAKLDEGYDVVYGYPLQQQHGGLRNLASVVTKFVLQSAMGADTASRISAFRAFRTELRNSFQTFRNGYVCIDVLLTYGTTRFACVNVEQHQRTFGTSNYTFKKLVVHAFNMITGFSTLPLQIASLNGFLCMGLGLLALIYVLGRYVLQGSPVPGFPFLASLISILGGSQLLALGIIGEYLARMYAKSTDRPTYTVRQFSNPKVHDTALPELAISSPSVHSSQDVYAETTLQR